MNTKQPILYKGLKSLIFLLIILMAGLMGCSSSDKKIVLGKSAIIVAFGDSLTKGVGATNGNSYPQKLATTISNHIKIIK